MRGWPSTRAAWHEVVVQKKLLIERPENITSYVLEVAFVQRVKSADLFREQHTCGGENDGGRENTERRRQAARAEAEIVQSCPASEDDCQSHHQRDRRENTLRGLGHPEDKQDQAVTENQLD